MPTPPFIWRSTYLDVLDQRLLPHEVKFISCRTPEEVAQVIREMAVRGAPAIGCCAAYGMVLAAPDKRFDAANTLRSARPTAVNVGWALDRQLDLLKKNGDDSVEELQQRIFLEAQAIEAEDRAANAAMGRYGAELIKPDSVLLTHCNAGSLATAGIGTAVGVIKVAFKRGTLRNVFVDETRPYLQGARLTAWEFEEAHIPYEIITDNMAGHLMATEKLDAVIIGCDRVAVNGDTANKIGSYSLAVLADYHRVPFYVAMPASTLDLNIPSGKEIPIEERSIEEVVNVGNIRIAPKGAKARHPAFDVTPAKLITAIITEKGVVRPPFEYNLKKLKE